MTQEPRATSDALAETPEQCIERAYRNLVLLQEVTDIEAGDAAVERMYEFSKRAIVAIMDYKQASRTRSEIAPNCENTGTPTGDPHPLDAAPSAERVSKPVPRWTTSWPDWHGIHENVEVVPASDYDALYNENADLWNDKRVAARSSVRLLIPDGLHPKTADLVVRFATALAEKLRKAEEKYGYDDGWSGSAWLEECQQRLLEHVAKGDPRDVAAYCAFMWHHGWRTSPPKEFALCADCQQSSDCLHFSRCFKQLASTSAAPSAIQRPFDPEVRRVVCAAIRSSDGVILCSPRHFDAMTHKLLKFLPGDWKGCEQGFVDQRGQWLTREEALHVALANGQIVRRCGGDDSELFSENLY